MYTINFATSYSIIIRQKQRNNEAIIRVNVLNQTEYCYFIFLKQQSILFETHFEQYSSLIVILLSAYYIELNGMIQTYLSLADSSVHFNYHPSRPLKNISMTDANTSHCLPLDLYWHPTVFWLYTLSWIIFLLSST